MPWVINLIGFAVFCALGLVVDRTLGSAGIHIFPADPLPFLAFLGFVGALAFGAIFSENPWNRFRNPMTTVQRTTRTPFDLFMDWVWVTLRNLIFVLAAGFFLILSIHRGDLLIQVPLFILEILVSILQLLIRILRSLQQG